ncbi:MAG: response regulator transcription factor, partial [Verrucomicrobiota bacterium]
VVMDFRMPGESGADTTRRLIERHPDAKVLILSVYEGEEDVGRAVQAGARGYLSKGVDTADLLDAITSLAEDRPYFPARIAQKIRKRDERGRLTEREMTTLELLVQGMSNKEISQELSISVATVKLHISNILEKMEVSDRTQAAIAAVQRGVVHLDD